MLMGTGRNRPSLTTRDEVQKNTKKSGMVDEGRPDKKVTLAVRKRIILHDSLFDVFSCVRPATAGIVDPIIGPDTGIWNGRPSG